MSDKITEVVMKAVAETIEGVDVATLKPEMTFESLNADSINKVEIATHAMRELNKKIPRGELGTLKTLQDLIEKLK